jgi:hypothetical protein
VAHRAPSAEEKAGDVLVTALETLAAAGTTLDSRTGTLDRLARYYSGTQGIAFLSPAAREAIGDRLRELPVNLTRVAVDVLAERLAVQGFRVGGVDDDAGLWRLWTDSRMVTGSAAGHLDSLLYGTGYVSVWTDAARRVRICPESPRQVVVTLDPQTGEPVSAVKRWHERRRGRAVVFEPDTVTRLRTASEVVEASGLPVDGWQVVDVLPNALGEVPVTPLPNRPRTGLPLGESEVLDALPLVDALSKLTQDMVVVSEAHSRPRRWATGLEVQEDEAGNPVNPFAESPERVWQAEDAAVRFGEFPASSLASFVEGTGVLLRQIAAVTAVPPAVLGLTSDSPASAEALRASEAGLVARARQRQTVLGEAWSRVGRHALIARDGVERPAFRDVEVSWMDSESRSEIVAADRAAKLHALGVPLAAILDDLGWSPQRIEQVLAARRAEALDDLPVALLRGTP